MDNPLKKYFRQPKIFTSLPTGGIYSDPGTYAGDVENMPIYGMTGMDEILMKTPDSLLSGESTVKVIESCCPVIKNAWAISILDLDPVLCAIRIATYGNTMTIQHTCSKCEAMNDYDIDLGDIMNHFKNCKYDGKINLKDITIKLRPLTYRAWTDFQIKSFGVQRQLMQATNINDEEERSKLMQTLMEDISVMRKDMMIAQIDSVEVPEGAVDQRAFISEWVMNSEQDIYEKIKQQIDKNRLAWDVPKTQLACAECSHEEAVGVSLDQTSFFANA